MLIGVVDWSISCHRKFMNSSGPSRKRGRKGGKRPRGRTPNKAAESPTATPIPVQYLLGGPLAGASWVIGEGAPESLNEEKSKKRKGRPTIGAASLAGQRDQLEWVFDRYWGKIGWQLERLRTHTGGLEDIQEAFEPIRGEPNLERIACFLRRTTIPSTGRQIKSTRIALNKAGVEDQRAREAHQAQVQRRNDAKAAVHEASPENRERLKTEIDRRVQNVRRLKLVESVHEEGLRGAERSLKKAESRTTSGAEGESIQPRRAFENAKAVYEKAKTARENEELIVQQTREHLAKATDQAWNFANAELSKREAELEGLGEQVSKVRAAWEKIERTLGDQEAGFAQTELARFLRSQIGAHTPRNLANAVAGLPDIGCRVSFRRCRKFAIQTKEPGLNYQTFEFVKRCWGKRDSLGSKALLKLFHSDMRRLPKTKREDGKSRVNFFRMHLEEHWPELADAIAETVKLKPLPRQGPYLILDLFQRNLGKPRTALDNLMRDRDKVP